MEHQGPAWAAALEASPLGVLMRDSVMLYPLANVLHVFGVVLLVGSMILLDLRLLGRGRSLPAVVVARTLTPVAVTGFALLVISGVALFSADARPLWSNSVFQVKLVLIALGIANALVFRALWNRRLAEWDAAAPGPGRAQALLSLLLWIGAMCSGRLIGYF